MRQKEKDKIRNRELLIDAAEKLIAVHGFAMTKIEDVTEEAGFSKATIYNYFENKEDLFIALIDRKFEEMVMEGEDVLLQDGTFEEVIEKYIRSSLNIINKNPNFYRIMMSEFYRFCPEFIVDQIKPRIHNVVMEFRIKLGMYFNKNKKHLRKGISPEDAASALSGLISSFMGDWLFSPEEYDLGLKAGVIFHLFMNGAVKKTE
jgi:AcrR family transcriptional regulator